MTPSRRRTAVVGGLLGALLVAGVGWAWADSLVPHTYSVMGMGSGGAHAGHADTAQRTAGAGPDEAGVVSVADLTGPRSGTPDVTATLTARRQAVTLADGRVFEGYTINGRTPGPTIEAIRGDLVEVTLVNAAVPEGITLHWHGVDVPNAEDGVAGVTQDAVPVGGRHVYRFEVEDAGTYWYHSHQVSHEQVRGGLFGVLIVREPGPADWSTGPQDVVVPVHTYDGRLTVEGAAGRRDLEAQPGEAVRARILNTDNGPLRVSVTGAPFLVVAVDGRDLVGPTLIEGRSVQVPAGGRYDLSFVVPPSGSVRLQPGLDSSTFVSIGPAGAAVAPAEMDLPLVDLLGYGEPDALPFDPERADIRFDYVIDQRPGFVRGRPGLWWTVNGRMFPDVPMFAVDEGDVVRMTVANNSGALHPMHLHGHHVVVLSHNGIPAAGSPWWVDSLDVPPGETYEIAFLADNPGVWMDHCHNLDHAAQGLLAHLAYRGVTTPFLVGGPTANHPE